LFSLTVDVFFAEANVAAQKEAIAGNGEIPCPREKEWFRLARLTGDWSATCADAVAPQPAAVKRRGLSGQAPGLLVLFLRQASAVFIFGLQDKRPSLLQEVDGNGQIIAVEAVRGLELVSILVGPLERNLVVGDFPVGGLRGVGKDAGRDAAKAEYLHGLRWRFRVFHGVGGKRI